MSRLGACFTTLVLVLAFAAPARAHFGMLIPEHSIVPMQDKTLTLTLSFTHPFEMAGMELVKPKQFFVVYDGEKKDLTGTLQKASVMDHTAWTAEYSVGRPGMYIFAFEPQPYPEPAEDNYIIHYTKTVVSAFDEGEDWNTEVGLKTEIVPLARPWGLYKGNVFQGVVKKDGKPVPYARVEVEYYNRDSEYVAPSDALVTQEVLADGNGVFTYACPKAGWWGFAALTDADYTIEGKDVELGAVIWVELLEWQKK